MPGIPRNVGAAPGGEVLVPVDAMHIEPADDVGGNAEPEVGAAAAENEEPNANAGGPALKKEP